MKRCKQPYEYHKPYISNQQIAHKKIRNSCHDRQIVLRTRYYSWKKRQEGTTISNTDVEVPPLLSARNLTNRKICRWQRKLPDIPARQVTLRFLELHTKKCNTNSSLNEGHDVRVEYQVNFKFSKDQYFDSYHLCWQSNKYVGQLMLEIFMWARGLRKKCNPQILNFLKLSPSRFSISSL